MSGSVRGATGHTKHIWEKITVIKTVGISA